MPRCPKCGNKTTVYAIRLNGACNECIEREVMAGDFSMLSAEERETMAAEAEQEESTGAASRKRPGEDAEQLRAAVEGDSEAPTANDAAASPVAAADATEDTLPEEADQPVAPIDWSRSWYEGFHPKGW